ncbi:hypothetical protein GQ54DRAFT_296449 [Martensiomyces pterosporus]|nr:hypothetical protein GQ54DRAFT_296449 [Martensiomyces pterosporus]
MQNREAKRNKEVRKKMREVAILHKDTSKLERKIEQYKATSQLRKLTIAEKEKLEKLKNELQEAVEKQKAAGIDPKKNAAAGGGSVGYDPMAGFEAGGKSDSSSDASDGDGEGDRMGEGPTGPAGYDDDLGIPTTPQQKRPSAATPGGVRGNSNPDEGVPLPPMPPGTPPLLPEDMDIGSVWPPLPKGPSPLYLSQGQHSHIYRGRGRSRGGGRGQEPSRRGHGYQQRRQHPYGGYRQQPDRPNMPYHHRPQSPSRVPPAGGHQGPATPVAANASGVQQRPVSQPRPSHGTVLVAEPKVRDLKRELTTLVPAAIARKNKQRERQRVLASVPMAPKMVVNAAPDVDASGSTNVQKAPLSTKASGILGSIKPVGAVHSSIPQTHAPSDRGTASHKSEKTEKETSSIDEEYKRFMKEMGGIL